MKNARHRNSNPVFVNKSIYFEFLPLVVGARFGGRENDEDDDQDNQLDLHFGEQIPLLMLNSVQYYSQIYLRFHRPFI